MPTVCGVFNKIFMAHYFSREMLNISGFGFHQKDAQELDKESEQNK